MPSHGRLARRLLIRFAFKRATLTEVSVTTGRPLLDRSAETQALERLVADAAEGVGGVVVLEGPAGIGKTALVRRAVRLAAGHDLRTLRATGSVLETALVPTHRCPTRPPGSTRRSTRSFS
jgi:serine kinase of HPr protein (carbohydrate metabolism regulator)